MTLKTECLEIGPIQKHFGIALMFHDVIHSEVGLDGAACGTGEARIG